MNLLEQDLQSADPSYRLIPLTRGQFAKVDPEDYDQLMQWKWNAMWSPHGRGFKATRGEYRDGKTHIVYMHRQIMNAPLGVEVDHRNHDTLDNRRSVNLRLATRMQNNRNARKRKDNTSGHKGIGWHSQQRKWRVRIHDGSGRRVNVGCFRSFAEAVEAQKIAAIRIHGEFACSESA